jgi:hypothetical protein
MKKIYLILSLCVGLVNLSAQTIPNGSFENWNNTQGYPEPDGWATFNIFSLFSGTDYGVTQESPGVVGSSYCRLTCTTDLEGLPTPAVAITGVINPLSGTGSVGFPVNNIPNFLSGQYRSQVVGEDIVGIFCYFTRYNAIAGITDTLAIGSLEITETQTAWGNFDLAVLPLMSGTPDTCAIFMLAGVGNFPVVGNYFDVDDLHFTGGVSSVEESLIAPFSAFPNPMKETLSLDLSSMENTNEVTLYTVQGMRVQQWQIGATRSTFSVEHLPAGIYVLHVSNKQGRWTQSLVKN